jgi:hypothetical protein
VSALIRRTLENPDTPTGGVRVSTLSDAVAVQIQEEIASTDAGLKAWASLSIDHLDPADPSDVAAAALRWAAALQVVVVRLAEEIDALKGSQP